MTRGSETCRVCSAPAAFAFEGRLIGRSVRYYECGGCGYLQTETPTWLEQAYASPINLTDTGLVARNLRNLRRVGALALLLGKPTARVVDFAGGHGLLVRLLRDAGLPALWADRYCENLYARGFEHQGEAADIATAFEAFEHFLDPGKELSAMLAVAPVVLLSTLIAPEPAPAPGTWWYYGEEHGQHIGFYRRRTLELLAARHGSRLVSSGRDLHILVPKSDRRTSMRALRIAERVWPVYRRWRLQSFTQRDFEQLRSATGSGPAGQHEP